jgi:hypothetical protein
MLAWIYPSFRFYLVFEDRHDHGRWQIRAGINSVDFLSLKPVATLDSCDCDTCDATSTHHAHDRFGLMIRRLVSGRPIRLTEPPKPEAQFHVVDGMVDMTRIAICQGQPAGDSSDGRRGGCGSACSEHAATLCLAPCICLPVLFVSAPTRGERQGQADEVGQEYDGLGSEPRGAPHLAFSLLEIVLETVRPGRPGLGWQGGSLLWIETFNGPGMTL